MNRVVIRRFPLRFGVAAITCTSVWTALTAAQTQDAHRERALDLLVMVTGQFSVAPTAGAGIVFGGQGDRLFIATANHVVRRGQQEAAGLQVRFRTRRETPIGARLLAHADTNLDLAVLEVEAIGKYGLTLCGFPLSSLRRPQDTPRRGDAVYPVGYPNGVEWAMPVTPDRLAEMRGDLVVFQSVFISKGHSGGALLTEPGELVGMIRADQPPFGVAVPMEKVIEVLARWGYPVALRAPLALHAAVHQRDVGEARRLLAGGCPPFRETEWAEWFGKGFTPLQAAARLGNSAMVKLFLDHGAAVDDAPDRGSSPLQHAAQAGYADVVSLLLSAGANVNRGAAEGMSPLLVASRRGHSDVVRLLLKAGASVDLRSPRGETPLFGVVSGDFISGAVSRDRRDFLEVARLLLAAGADPNVTAGATTPLGKAVDRSDREMVEILLRGKADPNSPGDVVCDAIRKGDAEIVRSLLGAGAAADRCGGRDGPLHFALGLGRSHVGVAKVLVAAGIDINRRGTHSRTPLLVAVIRYCGIKNEVERSEIRGLIELLFRAGADVNAQDDGGNRQGRTALQYARDYGAIEMTKVLTAHGARD